MNVVKCTNGHFFDGDSYSVCPHCGATQLQAVIQPANVQTPPQVKAPKAKAPKKAEKAKEKKGLFSGLKKKNKDNQPMGMAGAAPMAQVMGDDSETIALFHGVNAAPAGDNDETVAMFHGNINAGNMAAEGDNDETVAMFHGKVNQETTGTPAQDDDSTVAMYVEMPKANKEEAVEVTPVGATTQPVAPAQPAAVAQSDAESKAQPSLKEMIDQASANSDGKTLSYFSMMTSGSNEEKEEKPKVETMGSYSSKEPVKFPVGWLVCVSGKHLGDSFALTDGRNFIGRMESNMVVLIKDPSVSREKHACVVYEPKKKVFYLQPGDGSALTYLNDEFVEATRPINAHDVIEVGESKLMLIPLCSEEFSWETYIK